MSIPKQCRIALAAISLLSLSSQGMPHAMAAPGEATWFWNIQVISGRVIENAVHNIHPGMSRTNVLAIAGRPNSAGHQRNGSETWDYTFVDSWGHASVFSVVFGSDGIVTTKASARVRY